MNKCGDLKDFVLTPVFATVIVIVFVLGYILYFASTLPKDTSFEKSFLAVDEGLIMDTLPVFNGNIYILYSTQALVEKPGRFSHHFADSHVSVFEGSELKDDTKAAMKRYFQQEGLSYNTPKTIPAKDSGTLRFSKEANSIKVESHTGSVRLNLHAMHCPSEKIPAVKIVVLDAVHAKTNNKGSEGYTADGIIESYLNRGAAFQLQARLEGFNAVSTRDLKAPPTSGVQEGLEEDVAIEKRVELANTGDVFIALHAYLDEPAPNKPVMNAVKVFYNLENDAIAVKTSIKLACEVANALAKAYAEKDLPLSGLSIVPVSPKALPNEHFSILKAGKPGILVEYGNIKVVKDAVLIAEGIKNGFTASQ